MCQKDCLAQAPTSRQPHPLLLKATPTKHATKPRPSSTSNVGMLCGCGLIFNDIHRLFSFSLLPTYPILSSGSPKKQLINLVWPYVELHLIFSPPNNWYSLYSGNEITGTLDAMHPSRTFIVPSSIPRKALQTKKLELIDNFSITQGMH